MSESFLLAIHRWNEEHRARVLREFAAAGIVARPMGNGMTRVLSVSARPDTPYQVTTLDAGGEPVGHINASTLEDAAREMPRAADHPMPRSEDFSRMVLGRVVQP